MSIMASMTTMKIRMNWPKAAPRPSECASHARPRPAASPPSIPPQRGPCWTGGAALAGAGCAWFGAAGCAPRCVSRSVTLEDWRPTELPPPRRRAASASKAKVAITSARTEIQNFMSPPGRARRASALDSNMQCHDAAREVVIVHMAETAFAHEGFELLLPGVHADGFGQVAVARLVAGHPAAEQRQHVERIPVVGLRERLRHPGEFQHEQLAARFEHAVHLGQG